MLTCKKSKILPPFAGKDFLKVPTRYGCCKDCLGGIYDHFGGASILTSSRSKSISHITLLGTFLSQRIHVCYNYLHAWLICMEHVGKYTIHGTYGYQPCTLISLSQSDTESNQVSRLLLSLLLLLFFFFFFFLCFFFFFFLCEVKFTIVSCRMPSQQKCQNRRIARRMLVQKQDA